MPQVFGTEDLDLLKEASLWVEAASEMDIERATHPAVAAEARARGLVPLRHGKDPIWHHPESGKIHTLTPIHGGEYQGRVVQNAIANLRRTYPTPEEAAKASRSPEEIEADSAAAANATRTKKQQAVDAAKRKREQEAAILFRQEHSPFRNMGEVQRAYDKHMQSPKSRPSDTVENFAQRLRSAAPDMRQQIHRLVFPERYK